MSIQQGFKSNNGSDPARPVTGFKDEAGQVLHGQLFHGLTEREHFAAMAMQGFCANKGSNGRNDSDVAMLAVNAADALLKALEESV